MGRPTKMRDAIDHIARLNAENAALRSEVAALKAQNEKIAEMRIADCEAATKAEAEVAALKAQVKAKDKVLMCALRFIETAGSAHPAASIEAERIRAALAPSSVEREKPSKRPCEGHYNGKGPCFECGWPR